MNCCLAAQPSTRAIRRSSPASRRPFGERSTKRRLPATKLTEMEMLSPGSISVPRNIPKSTSRLSSISAVMSTTAIIRVATCHCAKAVFLANALPGTQDYFIRCHSKWTNDITDAGYHCRGRCRLDHRARCRSPDHLTLLWDPPDCGHSTMSMPAVDSPVTMSGLTLSGSKY